MPNCKVCNKAANSKCSRCNYTDYCGRECQINDWRLAHKRECAVFDDVANRIYVRLMGNIMIMAATYPNDIIVTIDDPVHDFLVGNMHLANLSLGNVGNEFNAIINIGGKEKSYPGRADMNTTINTKKYSAPGKIWSIVFEL